MELELDVFLGEINKVRKENMVCFYLCLKRWGVWVYI